MMTIRFKCSQCGKSFEVGSEFAGKRAKCKQCGHVTSIPVPSVPRAEAPKERAASSPAPRPARPRPEPFEAEPAPPPDIYGLDEEPSSVPLPPRAPLGTVESPSAPVKPRKRKKVGFFAGKSKSKGGGGSGGGKAKAGLSAGGFLSVLLIALRILFGSHGIFAPTGRFEVNRYFEDDVKTFEKVNSLLATVHDLVSAQAAAPQLAETLRQQAARMRRYKNSKAREADIEAARVKNGPMLQLAVGECVRQSDRVSQIGGINETFQVLLGPIQEIEEVEREVRGPDDGVRDSGYGAVFRRLFTGLSPKFEGTMDVTHPPSMTPQPHVPATKRMPSRAPVF